MPKSEGKSFLMNGFNSTSGDIYTSEKFRIDSKKEGFASIILILEAEEDDRKKFGSIKNISKFPHEDEYLIIMNNFFKGSCIEHVEKENY